MSNWPTPFFIKCPICNAYIHLEVTKRGAAPTCPGPAQEFMGKHICREKGWEVKIIGRKGDWTIPWREQLEIPEGKLFPEPKIFPRRKMKLKITGEKT